MRSHSLSPSESGRNEQGLGNTARSILMAYAPLFSNPEVHRHKVELEPPFFPFHVPRPFKPERVEAEVVRKIAHARKAARCQVDYVTIRFWFSESDKSVDFRTCWQEMGFMIGPPSAFYVLGNEDRIEILLLAPAQYAQAVTSMMTAKQSHLQCEIDTSGTIIAGLRDHLSKLSSRLDHALVDIVTPPPFFRSLGIPGDARASPFGVVFSALRNIPPPAIGIIRLLFAPTSQPWGQLTSQLVDYESGNLALGFVSKDVLQAATEKAAGGPFFAVSTWIAAFAKRETLSPILHSLSVPFRTLRYGSQPLLFLTEKHYEKVIKSRKAFADALLSPQTHRVGSLLTPAELEHIFEFPGQELVQNEDYPFQKAFAVRRPKKATERGLKLGYTTYAGMKEPVYQPRKLLVQHLCASGRTGAGKSVGMGQWALELIRADIGVTIIEPHRSLIQWLLERLPEKYWPRVIYFDPVDPDYVLKFNILELEPGQDIGKVADDRTAAIRAQYSRNFWGPEIQKHTDCLIQTGLSVPGLRLPDLLTLCETSYAGDKMRERALSHLENPELIRYWEHVFPHTSRDQLARVISKISPFLRKKLVGRIFYEKESFNFRSIIDSNAIFLADIPAGLIGGDSCNLLCSSLASSHYTAAMSRQNVQEEERRDFCLMMDEFQRITTRDLADALRECRKHRMAVFAVFQNRGQIHDNVRTALSNCNTLVAFDSGALDDATTIFKEFCGEVPMKVLLHKGERRAVCMIDGNITSLETYPAPKPLKKNFIREIRENSRRLYYVHRSKAEYYKEVKRSRAERSKRRRPRKPVFGQYDEVSE